MLGYNITGYLIFAFVTAITPGPNNYLLFSYGKQYGYKDSGKLMMGIWVGFFVLLYIAGYGIAGVITSHPMVELTLKIASSIWLLYLAVVLRNINTAHEETSNKKLGFYKGFFMQFVNPKAWFMAISGASAFLPKLSSIHVNVFIFAMIFNLVGIPSMIIWVSFGDYISKFLQSEKANKILGLFLFILMLISIVMIWL